MLEKRVERILEQQETVAKINKAITECDTQKIKLMNERFKAINDLSNEKANLGQVIAQIPHNIIVEINNKLYCVFYNRKFNTAGVVEAMSMKDAELKLCINKMETTK